MEGLEKQGKTAMLAAVDGAMQVLLLSLIRLKKHLLKLIKRMKEMGLEVIMITGDNKANCQCHCKTSRD